MFQISWTALWPRLKTMAISGAVTGNGPTTFAGLFPGPVPGQDAPLDDRRSPGPDPGPPAGARPRIKSGVAIAPHKTPGLCIAVAGRQPRVGPGY